MCGSQNPPHQNHRRGGAWPAGSFENTSNVQQFVMLILPGKEKYLPASRVQAGPACMQSFSGEILRRKLLRMTCCVIGPDAEKKRHSIKNDPLTSLTPALSHRERGPSPNVPVRLFPVIVGT